MNNTDDEPSLTANPHPPAVTTGNQTEKSAQAGNSHSQHIAFDINQAPTIMQSAPADPDVTSTPLQKALMAVSRMKSLKETG